MDRVSRDQTFFRDLNGSHKSSKIIAFLDVGSPLKTRNAILIRWVCAGLSFDFYPVCREKQSAKGAYEKVVQEVESWQVSVIGSATSFTIEPLGKSIASWRSSNRGPSRRLKPIK